MYDMLIITICLLFPLLIMPHQWAYTMCVVPVRPPALNLKKFPEEDTPVPRSRNNTGTASVFMSHRNYFLDLLGSSPVISLINIHSLWEWGLISKIALDEWQIYLSSIFSLNGVKRALRCTECLILCAQMSLRCFSFLILFKLAQ